MLFPLKMESFHQLGGIYMKINMTEATAWARITAYMAENRLNTAFEAESQQNMAVEAKIEDHENKETKDRRLDCIYDDEPLGFEKNPISEAPKMQAQDPLEEVDIGDGSIKRPTYISANITSSLKEKLVPLLGSCFTGLFPSLIGNFISTISLLNPGISW